MLAQLTTVSMLPLPDKSGKPYSGHAVAQVLAALQAPDVVERRDEAALEGLLREPGEMRRTNHVWQCNQRVRGGRRFGTVYIQPDGREVSGPQGVEQEPLV